MSEVEPKIGLFWGLVDKGGWKFVGISSPLSRLEAVGGFRTHPRGHVDVWPRIVRRRPELRGLGYEAMPRGRVNWVEEGDRFLLLLDPRLRTPAFIAKVMHRWRLPEQRTEIMTDPHYRTTIFGRSA
ncbi:MAG TPA: hypothetical protein VHZ26_06510 [Caulobacteraceae bacterium]|jgi:hypothetical protein|nr:hypothetical protein [Caulobacteraceae bacterium]